MDLRDDERQARQRALAVNLAVQIGRESGKVRGSDHAQRQVLVFVCHLFRVFKKKRERERELHCIMSASPKCEHISNNDPNHPVNRGTSLEAPRAPNEIGA